MKTPIRIVDNPNEYRRIEKVSIFTGKTHTMILSAPAADWAVYDAGIEHIQHALPTLTAEEREFLMTGCSPEEWAEMFPDESEHDEVEEVAHCRSAFSVDVQKGWESIDEDDLPF